MMEKSGAEREKGAIYYVPAPQTFQDTGYVQHNFNDGAKVHVECVPSRDNGGFMIRIVLSDNDEVYCDVTVDRFAALCLSDALIKNLINQEELNELKYRDIAGTVSFNEGVG